MPQLPGSDPIAGATNQIFARLLAKDPEQRPGSALEVVRALKNLRRYADSQQHHASTAAPEDLTVTGPEPLLPPAMDIGETVVAAQPHRPVAPPQAVTPAPPQKASPQPAGRKSKTILVATAIVLVSMLVGGGTLWALSTQFSSRSTAADSVGGTPSQQPANPSSPDVEPSPDGPSTSPEPTKDPASSPTRGAAASLVGEIRVGKNPHGIVVNPGSRLAFVANYHDSSVSVVNVDSNTVVRQIDVGKNPQHVAIDPATGLLLVRCDGIPAVQIYDLQRYSLVGSVSTGKGPIRLAVHSSQKVAYAVAQGSSHMQVISLETRKLIRTVKVGSNPRVIAVDERDQIAYIGHWDKNVVSVIDLASQSKLGELKVGKNPNSISIAPESRLAFVGNFGNGKDGNGSVSVVDLDTRSVRKTIDTDDGPSRVEVDEDANSAYVSCLYSATIDVIDLDTLTLADRLSTAERPTGVSVDSSTGRLYLTSFDKNAVQIFE